MNDPTVRQDSKLAHRVAQVSLELKKAQVKTRPMMAQFDPGNPTVVARFETQVIEVKVIGVGFQLNEFSVLKRMNHQPQPAASGKIE